MPGTGQGQAADTLPEHAQVVIVGGGVIGASIAYHLDEAGLARRRAAGTQPADGRDDLARGGADHVGGHAPPRRLLWMARYTARPVHLARGGDRSGDRLPSDRPSAPGDDARSGWRRFDARRRSFVGMASTTRSSRRANSAELWPEARIDDVLAAFYVADEGRVNPADLTMAYAKGARMGGARIIEGVSATGFRTARGRVTGVVTDQGTIEAEFVVNAAGMWARQVGAMAGVSVPLQAAEHYYLITDTVDVGEPRPAGHRGPRPLRLLPRGGRRDPRRPVRARGRTLVARRHPGRGRVRRACHPTGTASAPYLAGAMDRVPALHEAGVRTMFCGPESFTPDVGPLLGEAPELGGFFVAAGTELARHHPGRRRGEPHRPVDRRRRRRRST